MNHKSTKEKILDRIIVKSLLIVKAKTVNIFYKVRINSWVVIL